MRETIDGSNWHRVTFSIRPGDEATEEAVVLLRNEKMACAVRALLKSVAVSWLDRASRTGSI